MTRNQLRDLAKSLGVPRGRNTSDTFNNLLDAKAICLNRVKLFFCANCGEVYRDYPVTQCDCLPDKTLFIETDCSYYAPPTKS